MLQECGKKGCESESAEFREGGEELYMGHRDRNALSPKTGFSLAKLWLEITSSFARWYLNAVIGA